MTAPAGNRIDIGALKDRIDLEDVIRACGVDLKKHGKEFSALCPFHSERTPSFKVTPATQLYYCAGCGAGGDSIKFLCEFYGVGFKDAAKRLTEIAGGGLPTDNVTPIQRAARREPEPPKWVKQPHAPENAPPPLDPLRIMRDGEWTDAPVVASWAYHDRAGNLVGHANRIEYQKPDGSTGKDVIPTSWQLNTETGEECWRQGAFEEPRPLYGADLLDADADANVILVEGEKACDAARRLLAGTPFLVLTWPGGCKAVDKADWSALAGRKVVGWPDCDSQRDRDGATRPYAEQPGMGAMLRIAELLAAYDVEMRIVAVEQPHTIADGWDLADAEAEGWDRARVMDSLRARLATPAEIRERSVPVEPAPANDNAPPPVDDEPPPPTEPPAKPGKADKEKPNTPPRGLVGQLPFRALGYNHGHYYYLSAEQRQIHEYQKSDHTPNGLMQLANLSFWQDAFSYGDKMKGEHWQAATDALMRMSGRAGIFDTDIIRGRGCWVDRSDGTNRVIMNLGNRLLVDGQDTEFEAVDSHYIYEAGPRMAGPSDRPLTVAEARRVLDLAKRFNWEMPASAALLAGWVVLAPLCGALPWRPHIWITGGSFTGKTTILEKFIVPLLARTELQVQGNSTEAGVRQKLRADARPVVFDETEKNNEREAARIDNVLSLIRQASSESHARTLKGTTHGRNLEFHIRSMFCLSSIQVGMDRQADHTRISVLGLWGKQQKPKEEWDALQQKWVETEQLLLDLRDEEDFGARLVARSVAMTSTILENIRTMTRVAGREFQSQRLGDQYGTLLAGAATLIYDHPISEEGALKFLRLFDWNVYHEAANEDESYDALTSIMQVEHRIDQERGSVTMTTGELVAIVVDNSSKGGVWPGDAVNALGRLGLKVKRGIVGKDAGLMIANKSERLQRALRGNPWASDWRSYLRRLPGAKAVPTVVRFADGFVGRATEVPIHVALPGGEGED